MSMNRKTYEIREKFVPSEKRAAIVKLQKRFCLNFMGTTLGWFQFWSQFVNEIFKADINPVSKFSYLKELLMPNKSKIVNRWFAFYL